MIGSSHQLSLRKMNIPLWEQRMRVHSNEVTYPKLICSTTLCQSKCKEPIFDWSWNERIDSCILIDTVSSAPMRGAFLGHWFTGFQTVSNAYRNKFPVHILTPSAPEASDGIHNFRSQTTWWEIFSKLRVLRKLPGRFSRMKPRVSIIDPCATFQLSSNREVILFSNRTLFPTVGEEIV